MAAGAAPTVHRAAGSTMFDYGNRFYSETIHERMISPVSIEAWRLSTEVARVGNAMI